METLALVWAATLKDLRRRLRDPFALLLWLGIPIAIGGLLVLAMGGSNGPQPKALLFVVDHDDSFLSGMLVQALSSEQAKIIEAKVLPEAEARERMDSGEASGLLVIPAGFGEGVFRERPTRLELVTNPSQRILPGVIENALAMLSEATFYVHRVFGDELRDIADGTSTGATFEDLAIAETSVRIRHDMERIGKYVFPPAIVVDSVIRDVEGEKKKERSFGSYFFPGMLLMALMFMAEGLADDVWRERALGVLRRSVVGPLGIAPALAGKLFAGWMLMLGTSVAGLLLAVAAFGVEMSRVPASALWVSAAGVLLLALMVLLKLSTTSQRASGLIGNLVLFPLLMAGGCFIPLEAMPAWMADVGRFTPNGWSLNVLKEILFGEPSVATLAIAAGTLGLACGVLYTLCALRMRAFSRA